MGVGLGSVGLPDCCFAAVRFVGVRGGGLAMRPRGDGRGGVMEPPSGRLVSCLEVGRRLLAVFERLQGVVPTGRRVKACSCDAEKMYPST